MYKAVKKWGSGSGPVSVGLEAEEDEAGIWHYLVVDTNGIRPREDPMYTKEAKRSDIDRIKEGTILEITCRRRCGWTRWLQVSSTCSSACGGGWVFDVSPKDKAVRLVEVEVVTGEWQYQAMCDRVHLLPKPSPRLAAKPGRGFKTLENQELVTVKERLRPLNSKGAFLRLADGRGYVLDFARGRQVVQRWQSAGASAGDGATASSSNDPTGPFEAPAAKAPLLATSSWTLLSNASAGDHHGVPEFGEWTYIVLDSAGMTLRGSPTYDKKAKLPSRIAEGDLVKVVERRIGCGTTFLRLETPAGWAFDVQPCGSCRRQRMLEVKPEYGLWYYRVCAAKGIALRSRCSFSDDAKVGKGPSEGVLLSVVRRVRVGEITFLRTRDDGESGWIFDRRGDRHLVEGPIPVRTHEDLSGVVCPADGAYLRSAPTAQKWAGSKRLLLQGARVQVVLTCEVEGQDWCQVSRLGGMAGWLPAQAIEMERSWALDSKQRSEPFSVDLLRKALAAGSLVPA